MRYVRVAATSVTAALAVAIAAAGAWASTVRVFELGRAGNTDAAAMLGLLAALATAAFVLVAVLVARRRIPPGLGAFASLWIAGAFILMSATFNV